MLKLFFAKIILYLDVRYRFINVEFINTLSLTTYAKKNIFKKKKENVTQKIISATESLSAREFYALELFWRGIPPHPKFLTTKKLPKNKNLKLKIGYVLYKRILGFLQYVNPEFHLQQLNLKSGKIFADMLTHEGISGLQHHVSFKKTSTNISVVIPVYNAYQFLKSCLDSVLSTTDAIDILVVNDASTDLRVSKYLSELHKLEKIRLIENSVNLGFVKSANIGFNHCGENDVVLLNSDTIVFDGWIDGLLKWLNLDLRIATITAMSNAATIYSLPFESEFECGPEITKVISDRFKLNDHYLSSPIEIPTCHGFCVLVARRALDELGPFDEFTFGRGYGEENDFSLRATKSGFKNILAANVVVHHYGSKSFEESKDALAETNLKKLLSKHPSYLTDVENFLAQRPLSEFRIMAMSAIQLSNHLDIATHVMHSLGGGVEKSLEIETKDLNSILLTIKPCSPFSVNLRFSYRDLFFTTVLEAMPNQNLFKILFEYLNVRTFTIQHLAGYSDNLINSLLDSSAEFTLRLHDYFYLCPRIHLTGTDFKDCNLPTCETCNNCLRKDTVYDIDSYRLLKSSVLRSASKITAPSSDAVNRFNSVYRELNIEKTSFDTLLPAVALSPKGTGSELVIAIPGELTEAKGFSLVEELSDLAKNWPIKFVVLGPLGPGLKSNHSNIKVSGRYYSLEELVDRVRFINPHLFLFPSRVPETYSYALTEVLSFGIPIAYFETGAIHERLMMHSLGIPFSIGAPAEDLFYEIISRFMLSKREAKK
jgi:GT2 family glycosyltransferase